MAELNDAESLPVVATCCSPAAKTECCEPEAKASCCDEDDFRCGCTAGEATG